MECTVTIQNFINGEFLSTVNHIESFNPSNGHLLALVPDSGSNDVDKAVSAAKAAFTGWSSTPVKERSTLLLRVADLIESRLNEFAEAETMDQGKPLWLTRELDIPRAILNFRHFANTALCDTDKALHLPESDVLNYTIHVPAGVAALVVPWNLPLYLLTFKLAPALVYGNTVIVKPSEFTSVTAWMLCSVLKEAGIPEGVVNVVFGYGPKVGEALIGHPDVTLISFTGSTTTGCHIAEVAGKKNKKLSLEMGGKNAAVVFEDADLLKCVPALIRGSFLNQGQICLSTSRIYVQRKVFHGFLELFVKETKSLKVGNPMHKETFLGPLCHKDHFCKVQGYLKYAKEKGITFLTGKGDCIDLPEENKMGYYVQPTVLTDVPDDNPLMQEEVFGPVTVLVPFDTEEEVINLVNGTRYGLCASIWSANLHHIHSVSQKLEVGTVWCNCWLLRNLHMPFGGMKMSGMGREGTEDSRDFYTNKKTVCVKYG